MLLKIAYAVALVVATTLVHAGCTAAALGRLRSLAKHHWALRSTTTRATVLSVLVLLMSLAACFESALWAGLYWGVGALPEWREAFYFSLVTFTTLGYGDVTLGDEWRLLAAFEAANGIMMFGWTTALIVAAAQRLFLHRAPDETGS
jgi:hypothetical protein